MKPGNVYRQLVALLPLFSQEVLLSICISLEDLTLSTHLATYFHFFENLHKIFLLHYIIIIELS
jgi:hypothetical protein